MTFTFTNYAGIQPQRSPLHNLIGDILGGYTDTTKAQFLRPTLQEQLQKAQLENKWYEPNIKSQIGLRGAQAGHLGAMTQGLNISNPFLRQKLEDEAKKRQFEYQNPLLSHTGAAGQIGALMYLQQHPELMQSMGQQENQNQEIPNIGEGQSYIPSLMQKPEKHTPNPMELLQQSILSSLNPKQKQFAPSNIGKLHQELNDIKAGFYPNSNRLLPIESDQKKQELAAPYEEKLGGLPQGQHWVHDPNTHERIAVDRPFTPKERENEVGSILFNEFYPDINKGFKDFIGKDSINNFNKYTNEYGKNAEATKKIDDLLYATQLVTSGVINEQATLNAGKTNVTFRKILDSFPKTDIPNLIQRYQKELKIPGQAFYNANERFLNKMNSSRDIASNKIPQFKRIYLHPEKHLKNKEEQEKNLDSHSKTVTVKNKKTGQIETISIAEAKNRGIKNV